MIVKDKSQKYKIAIAILFIIGFCYWGNEVKELLKEIALNTRYCVL